MRVSRRSRWGSVILLVVALLVVGCCPIGNNAPQITSLSADPATVGPSGNTTLSCVATDADGDTLTYSWSYSGPSVGTIVGTGSTVGWTVPDVEGTYTVSVSVADGKGGTDDDDCTVTVAVLTTTGSIDVNSSPAGAQVYLDGSDTGNITPYVITGVDEGDHTVTLSLVGHKDKEGTVEVEAGETTYINWELDESLLITETIQPDALESKDALVFEVTPGSNYGAISTLEVGKVVVGKSRSYIRFDLPAIPTTAVVTEATLSLWYVASTSATETTIDIYPVTSAWAENTITWDDQPTHGPVAQGSEEIPATGTSDFVEWDIQVSLIEGWVDGSVSNHGILLIDADEDTDGALKDFRASEGPAAQRPKLEITFYDPAP